jgi:hypothetical protein
MVQVTSIDYLSYFLSVTLFATTKAIITKGMAMKKGIVIWLCVTNDNNNKKPIPTIIYKHPLPNVSNLNLSQKSRYLPVH